MPETRSLLLALFLGAFLPASAALAAPDCAQVARLANLYEAYRATDSNTGPTRRAAAAQLYHQIPLIVPESAASRIEVEGVRVEAGRLRSLLRDAKTLSQEVLATGEPSDFRASRRATDIAWLARIVDLSGCFETAAAGGLDTGIRQTASPDANAGDTQPFDPLPLNVVLAILAMLLLGALIEVLRRNTVLRAGRLQRLPRHIVAFRVLAEVIGEDGAFRREEVKCSDLSLGGAKVHWTDPPTRGTRLIIDLPTGPRYATVVWNTPHFAGIMFRDRLSPAELTDLIKSVSTGPASPTAAA